MSDVIQLPEDAFLADSTEELDSWITGRMTGTPEWISSAVRALQPLERQALKRLASDRDWASESARWRLKLAALDQDGLALSCELQEDLVRFDKHLRSLAKAETNDDVRMQIGAIRMALRPYLVQRSDRRERIAYGGARIAV